MKLSPLQKKLIDLLQKSPTTQALKPKYRGQAQEYFLGLPEDALQRVVEAFEEEQADLKARAHKFQQLIADLEAAEKDFERAFLASKSDIMQAHDAHSADKLLDTLEHLDS